MKRHHVAALVALILSATALFGQSFVTRRWDDAAIPDAVSFAAGNKLMGLNGSVVTRFSRSVFDALYALKSRSIATTAPLSGGGDLSADRTLTVANATTSAVGVVELATDGEDAANVVVQGNDARMDNARTPTAHASTHLPAGSDPIDLGSLFTEYSPDNEPSSCWACENWTNDTAALTWTQANWGGVVTETLTADSSLLEAGTTGACESRVQWVAAPASGTDFTVTVKLAAAGPVGGALYFLIGGTTATPTDLELVRVNSGDIRHDQDANYTISTIGPNRGTWSAVYKETDEVCLQGRWTAATNALTMYYAFDCMTFRALSASVSGLAADPTNVGWSLSHCSGSQAQAVRAKWFRIRTDASRNLAGE